MIKRLRILLWLFCIIHLQNGYTQSNILEFDQYLDIVRNEHPVAFKANLLQQMADANTLMAKGQFDPSISTGYDRKSFDGKNYYSIASGILKVPTWYGIDIKAGYDQTTGDFLDPSDGLPPRGLWNIGISAPLGNGLVFDQRRAEIRKAQVFQESNQVERQLMLNDLIFEASWAYFDWQAKYETFLVSQLGLTIAEDRFEATVQSVLNGDKPAVDTLESLIAVQNRTMDTVLAYQELTAARINLENFLWQNGEVPLIMAETVTPEPLDETRYFAQVDSLHLLRSDLISIHPELLLYDYKIDFLEIEERLNLEALKPTIEIGFSPLIGTTEQAIFSPYSTSDYKLGASVYYPLFLRKERGKLRMTRVKIQDTGLDRGIKTQSITTKLSTYYNNVRSFELLVNQQAETTNNYQRLLEAENEKFTIGESSIFLINSREVKYLEAQYKLVDQKLKLLMNRLKYLLSSGMISTI